MPLLLPKTRGLRRETNFSGQPSATWGNAITSDSVAHTLPAGNATEIIASTAFDADWVNVWFINNYGSNTRSDSLLNIYIGAAGSEQLLISNLLAGWAAPLGTGLPKWYSFPLLVPAGSRISAKHQSIRTNTNAYVLVELLAGTGDHWSGQKVECVGAVTGSSRGTTVTPGAAAEGTLTSLGTSTYEWGYVQPMMGGNVTDTSMNAAYVAADIGSGASTTISGLTDFLFNANAGEWTANMNTGRFAPVPASTTVYLCSQTSAAVEDQDFCVYGVY